MKRSIRDLSRAAIVATDGHVGFVEQAFFDDEAWTIRYLVADTGREFGERRVLVSPVHVTEISTSDPAFIAVGLTRRQVANSPDIDTEKPVSRQMESAFNKYFSIHPYWGGPGLWGAQMVPADLPPLERDSWPEEGTDDVHLRSTRELMGYRVRAKEGRIGRAEDFLFDETTWRIHYIGVRTGLFTGRRRVLVSSLRAMSIDWAKRTIALDLPGETVRNAPEYPVGSELTPEFETGLRSYYSGAGK